MDERAKLIQDIIIRADLVKNLLGENISMPENGVKGENILLYGVPGAGKSYYVKKNYGVNESKMERVVFHPDYTYSDLVGQILPRIKKEEGSEKSEKLEYIFNPGPFTRILKEAVASENKEMYYFIIEEINRGNAPAIFGDIFQLLDRNEYGESEYSVTNYDIAEVVYGDQNVKVKIPNNLTIIATMNTADQNVFTLDTAFKRRWTMKMIPNDFALCSYSDMPLFDTNITWRMFAETINKVIEDKSFEMISNEDKRIGAFFVSEDEAKNIDHFAQKVLMFLWNDVFKYNNREEIFNEENTSLEKLVNNFKTQKFGVFKGIFAE